MSKSTLISWQKHRNLNIYSASYCDWVRCSVLQESRHLHGILTSTGIAIPWTTVIRLINESIVDELTRTISTLFFPCRVKVAGKFTWKKANIHFILLKLVRSTFAPIQSEYLWFHRVFNFFLSRMCGVSVCVCVCDVAADDSPSKCHNTF